MKTINVSDDYQLSRVQEFAAQEFNSLPTKFPVLNGQYVTASIATSDTSINHTLKRQITGWLVVRKDAQGDVWESSTVNPRPGDQIIFKASSAVNVTLYFF